jgi:enamine deaminase RidA (YjgF/YER057c/UK114 family)
MTEPTQAGRPLARYSAWLRRGDFIFMSGVIAVDPSAKRIVRGFADLPPGVGARIGETGEFSTDMKDGPILAQSWFVLEAIRRAVEEAGGQMSDVFKLVQYFKNLADFPRYASVRKLFFPAEPPVSTVVEVSAMMPSDEILIEVEATAFLPLSR